MQESRVKNSGRKSSNNSKEIRNGKVSRVNKRREIVGTVDAATAGAPAP
jgi:hypothetical protein